MPSFGQRVRRANKFPGRAGVEIYPDCYKGRFQYCGWQIIGGSGDIPPLTFGRISVLPIVSEHFDPKAVYMFGIDPSNPSTNLRFTVGAITVGGEPQIANNDPMPTGIGDEILGDCFNRSDQPLLVDKWSVISTEAFGSPLVFDFFNLNALTIRIFISLWGNGMTDDFVSEWKEAESHGKSFYIVQTSPLDEYDSFKFISTSKDDHNGREEVCEPIKRIILC